MQYEKKESSKQHNRDFHNNRNIFHRYSAADIACAAVPGSRSRAAVMSPVTLCAAESTRLGPKFSTKSTFNILKKRPSTSRTRHDVGGTRMAWQ